MRVHCGARHQGQSLFAMNVSVRTAVENDAAQLVALRRQLFAETSFMLFEPEEFTSTAEDERKFISWFSQRPNSRLLAATHEESVVGFLAAMGGERNRLQHSALVFLGVAQAFWSQGIASRMLAEVIAWAPSVKLKRLELTVHTTNLKAIALYLRHGFVVEGTRRCSFRVNGQYTDEYLMSLITKVSQETPIK